MNITSWRLIASLAALSSSAFAAAATPDELTLYAGKPLPGWHVTVADAESQKTLDGAAAVVPPPAKTPDSRLGATRTAKDGKDDAITLRWKDSWNASLRVDGGAPLDLRPYADQGVLALDVDVRELAQGGIAFKVGCGDKCERIVPYLVPARAMAGQGWRHLVFSMRCFTREGDDFGAVARPFSIDANGSGELAIANVKFLKTGTPNAACPDYKTVSVTPDKLNETWSINWWTPRHEKKLEEVKAVGKKSQLIFVGDSITEGWEKGGAPVWERYYKQFNAIGLGFGGDRTENVLWRLQHGEVDGLAPKVAVLLIGTNNAGHRQENPKTTAAGIRRDIDELQQRLPDTKILLLAIFPRGEKADDPLRLLNDKVNAIIAGYADGKKIFFADINQDFLAPDGTLSKDIMPDLLHPNERGYEIWARAMAPALQRLMP
jgi:beta-glucosidase